MRYSNLPSSCTLQRASRLRETRVFKTQRTKSSVSSTRNTNFQNHVSSRLRETVLFFTNCSLVYAKHSLWEAAPSRAQPSPAEPSQCKHTKKHVSSMRNDVFKMLQKNSVSSTRNAHFPNQVSSRLRETLLTNWRLVYAKHLLWEAKPSRAQPSPAEPSRSEPSKNPQRKIKLRLVYTKYYFSEFTI